MTLDKIPNTKEAINDPLEGKLVIVRGHSCGVHVGFLVNQENNSVLLRNSKRLWSWKTKKGVALNGLAKHGIADGSGDD